MGLRIDIEAALEAAADEGDEAGAAALRLVQCAIKDRDRSAVSATGETGCDDAMIQDVVRQVLRRREGSARAHREAGEHAAAGKAEAEAAALRSVLPPQLSESQIRSAAVQVVTELQATSLKDVGRCLSEIQHRYGQLVDPAKAGAAVKSLLAS